MCSLPLLKEAALPRGSEPVPPQLSLGSAPSEPRTAQVEKQHCATAYLGITAQCQAHEATETPLTKSVLSHTFEGGQGSAGKNRNLLKVKAVWQKF